MPARTDAFARETRRRLRGLRRRRAAQWLARDLGAAWLAWVGALLLLGVAHGTGLFPLRLVPPAAAGALLVVMVWVALHTLQRWPRLARVAGELDRLGETRDRLTTALAFASTPGPISAAQGLAERECAAFFKNAKLERLLPWRIPREFGWSLVPALALAFVLWDGAARQEAREMEIAAARTEVDPAAKELEALARKLSEAAEKENQPELQKLAQEMNRRAKDLRERAAEPEQAREAALKEISTLEQMARDLQAKPPGLSAPEQKELAEALENADATREAARALRDEKPEDAAKALEEAAKRLAEGGEKEAAQAQAALQQALERLEQQRQLSEALRKLGQNQSKDGAQGAAAAALQKLAQMLKQAPRPGQQTGQASASPDAQKALQKLLAALQNMKGDQGAPAPGEPSDESKSDSSMVAIQSFAPGVGGDAALSSEASVPTGQPGSERDPGTTNSPFGTEKQEPAQKGADLALRGQTGGTGETVSQMMAGGPDVSKARRRYKELYEAMAPAAEDAVQQEDIPIGSRLFIKRYFELIRPKE